MTQQQALDILKLGKNVFLTGFAGSGKTHVLSEYISYLQQQGIGVGITASTGVAATQIGGVTLHSWAGIGVQKNLSPEGVEQLVKRKYLRKRFRNTQVLVVDEISMLSIDTLSMVDKICQTFKGSRAPFGGMQVVFCGDFFQLPPVVAKGEPLSFIFESGLWQKLDLYVCYLDKEYRQQDADFVSILHEIRENTISKSSIKTLASCLYKPLSHISTRLYTHNQHVDTINSQELLKLPTSPYVFEMEGEGSPHFVEVMKKNSLVPATLMLKKGAVVMFLKNNFEKGYVNGTLGVVEDFTKKGLPIVITNRGEVIEVAHSEWNIEEDGEEKARIRQLPLRLAWAMTVHKSQGMSLDAAEIDLGRPFVPGMGYVALSRIRSLKGLRLMGLNHKALVVDEKVLAFDYTLRNLSTQLQEELAFVAWYEIEAQQKIAIEELKEQGKKDKRKRFYDPHASFYS